jgi:hypothetical protein
MKHIKMFEKFSTPDYNITEVPDIENVIPKELIYSIFEKYSLSCDPKQNKSLNEVEYTIDNNHIKCSFTTYSYDGRVTKNILTLLDKIQRELKADGFTFGNYSRSGSYLVTFEYSNETLQKLELEQNINKYNL